METNAELDEFLGLSTIIPFENFNALKFKAMNGTKK